MENTTASLWAALARAQGKMSEPKFDKDNSHFKNKYATLSAVWAACREPLSSEGLSVVQGIETHDSKFILVTLLAHTSGEQIKFHCPIITSKNDMQGLGSAITYARRYSLNALIGTSGEKEDDDGESAVGRGDDKDDEKSGDKKGEGKSSNTTESNSTSTQNSSNNSKKITPAQVTRLWTIAGELGWNADDVHKSIRDNLNIESVNDFPSDRYDKFIRFMEQNPKPKWSS